MLEATYFSIWVSITVLTTMAVITRITLYLLDDLNGSIDAAITLIIICLSAISWYFIFTSTITLN